MLVIDDLIINVRSVIALMLVNNYCKIVFSVTVTCYCYVLLLRVTVTCYCYVLLLRVTVTCYYYVLLLRVTVIVFSVTVTYPSLIEWFSCSCFFQINRARPHH